MKYIHMVPFVEIDLLSKVNPNGNDSKIRKATIDVFND